MAKLTLHHLISEPREQTARPPVLILLHGVRSNEEDLPGLALALDARFFVISARAPMTLGPGAYGWYNIEFTPDGYLVDEREAVASRDLVLKFVQEVKDTYPI